MKVTTANAPGAYSMMMDALSNYTDEFLSQNGTSRAAVERGIKSLFDVISSLDAKGREVEIDVIGSIDEANKLFGFEIKEDDGKFVVSSKIPDADRVFDTMEEANAYTNRVLYRGVNMMSDGDKVNISVLLPAMLDNTGYHEALHSLEVFDDKATDKLVVNLMRSLSRLPRLDARMIAFMDSYRGKPEAERNREFLAELGSMISSGEISIEVRDSVIKSMTDTFMKFVRNMLGIGGDVTPSAGQLARTFNDIADKLGRGEKQAPYVTTGGTPKFQRVYADVVNGLYPNTENALAQIKQDKGTGNWWSGQLLSRGAKSDEMNWTTLADFLEANKDKSITKSDISQYLKDNRIEIKEVVKRSYKEGGLNDEWTPGAEENNGTGRVWKNNGWKVVENAEDDYSIFYPDGSKFEGTWSTKDGAFQRVKSIAPEGTTKFSNYQLEGEKDDYKEILVTLPRKSVIDKTKFFVEEVDYGGGEVRYFATTPNSRSNAKKTRAEAQAELDRVTAIYDEIGKDNASFKSNHFDEPNILVHLRMNTRTDADGNKVLFLEEIQSDWGQKGRKEGFEGDKAIELFNQFKYEVLDVDGKKLHTFLSSDGETVISSSEKFESAKKTAEDIARRNAEFLYTREVPKAPFVTDTNAWTKLGLKIALREAVRQNADRLAWTTGEQQNERYDLSKTVSEVYFDWDNDRGLGVLTVFGFGTDNKLLEEVNVPLNKIQDYIGKEPAEKIIEQVNSQQGKYRRGKLEGEGLKIGGKGMRAFYGVPSEGNEGIIGKVAKSIVKELTGKSGEIIETKIETQHQDVKRASTDFDISEAPQELAQLLDKYSEGLSEGNYDVLNKFLDEAKELGYEIDYYLDGEITSFRRVSGKPQQSTQHSIEITPELKAEVKKGVPKFQIPIESQSDQNEIEQERRAIEEKAKKDKTFGKAPNGKKSNLTDEQWVTVRTKRFKDWFGDWQNDPENASKVVDANGEPMVVYHGTDADFDVFDNQKKGSRGGLREMFWAFTTNKKVAELYGSGYTGKSKPNIVPVFLNIRQMPVYDNGGNYYRELRVDAGYKFVDIFQLQQFHYEGFKKFGANFDKADGFLVKNTIEKEGPDLFKFDYDVDKAIAFDKENMVGDTFYVREPNQIKSATSNVGTFSEGSPSIMFQTPIDEAFDKSQALLDAMSKRGGIITNLVVRFADRSSSLKKKLIEANLKNARDLFVAQAGAGSRAKMFIDENFGPIYNGLNKQNTEYLDKIIQLRRIIQIDEDFDSKGKPRIKHTADKYNSPINKEVAKKNLVDFESILGTALYNDLISRSELYFDSYKKLLSVMRDNGLITQDLYDKLKDLLYQPRKFLDQFARFEEGETVLDIKDLALNEAQIKTLESGSDSEIMMNSKLLLAFSAKSVFSRVARNKTYTAISEAKKDPNNNKWISNKQLKNFKPVNYFVDGVRKQFFIREDYQKQLYDSTRVS